MSYGEMIGTLTVGVPAYETQPARERTTSARQAVEDVANATLEIGERTLHLVKAGELYNCYTRPPITDPQEADAIGKLIARNIAALPKPDDGLETLEPDEATVFLSTCGIKADTQRTNERTYTIKLEAAPSDAVLSPEEIVERMELNHVVKVGPDFRSELEQERPDLITFVKNQPEALRTSTSQEEYRPFYASMSERQAMMETHGFLLLVRECGTLAQSEEATDILDTLTLLTTPRIKEATLGIATYWKALLDCDPQQQLLAYTGASKVEETVKSDEYLLDNILAHFDDDEAERYRGRLITDPADITVQNAANLKTVLLDDWTISGLQLADAAAAFAGEYPEFESTLEVQLLVGDEDRITRGLERRSLLRDDPHPAGKPTIPTRAYYKAHPSNTSNCGVRITSTDSSVDFGFENTFETFIYNNIKDAHNLMPEAREILSTMPPLTNIVRPYRQPGYRLTRKQRFGTAK